MNKLFNILTKAGFEVQTTGSDIFPAVLKQEGIPIGFLLDNLQVSLVADKESVKPALDNVIKYAFDFQDFDELDGQTVLSSYRNIALTAVYDFESGRSKFNLCRIEDGKCEVLQSDYERAVIAEAFTKQSGIMGDIPETPEYINGFIKSLKDIGYKISEYVSVSDRKYEILSSEGELVGYINKSNTFTLLSEDKAHKQLNKLYRKHSPAAMATPFMERFKNSLQLSGMALKGLFDKNGAAYEINADNKVIATLENAGNNISYTKEAAPEQVSRIESLLKEEDTEKGQPISEIRANESQEKQQNESLSVSDLAVILAAVVAHVPEIKELIPAQIQEKLGISVKSGEDIIERAEETNKTTPQETEINLPNTEKALSPEQQELLNEFDRNLEAIDVMRELNSPDVNSAVNHLAQTYGTADRTELLNSFSNDESGASESKTQNSLQERIQNSQERADMQNASRPLNMQEQEL